MKKYCFLFLILFNLLWADNSELLKKTSLSLFTYTNFSESDNQMIFDSLCFGGKGNFILSDIQFSKKGDKQNFGISLKSDNLLKKFPFTIKYGNLSAGGSYSKLSNPLLSAPSSPFPVSSSTANCISASLPASSSFSKPETIFFQGAYLDTKKIIQNLKLNFFYNPDTNETSASTFIKIKCPNNLKIDLSATAGTFLYEENTFSSWFTTQDFYYHQGIHNCGNISLSVNIKNAGTFFSTSFYESPFGYYDAVFKSENYIKTKHLVLNLCGLYSSNNNIITSSQKTLTDCIQIKSGISYKNRCKTSFPLFIKAGFSAYGNLQLSQKEHSLRFITGFQLTSNLTALTLSGIINTKILVFSEEDLNPVFDNGSIQLTNVWYFPKVTTTLKTSFTVNPSSDFSYITYNHKYSASLRFANLISVSTALNLSLKDNQLKKMSENSTFQLQIHKNRINYTYKLTFDWQQDS